MELIDKLIIKAGLEVDDRSKKLVELILTEVVAITDHYENINSNKNDQLMTIKSKAAVDIRDIIMKFFNVGRI